MLIQWLRGDDFLITSLYSIGDDEEKQCRLLYDLMETHSACLAIKTGKYAHYISDKMIAIADKNHFPLLRIPYEMTYIDIIMDAHECHYDRKQQKGDAWKIFIRYYFSSFSE